MSHTTTMTPQQARDKVRQMNLQINSQLKRAGVLDSKGRNIKNLGDLPDSEWKSWMYDLMSVRDYLITEYNIN